MTVKEADKNGTLKNIKKPYILMDINKRRHFNIQHVWNSEIDHIEMRENFKKAIVVLRIKSDKGTYINF